MTSNEKRDLLVMKFLHYFITEKNYNPVIVHGIENEIWLENMDNDIRIVRIVTGYIHNKEQLDFDNFKLNRLTRQIKLKTFTLKMKTLSLYLDLNDNVELNNTKNDFEIRVKSEKSINNNEIIKNYFPDMPDKLVFNEKGVMLYQKINSDIMAKNINENEKINNFNGLFDFDKEKQFTSINELGKQYVENIKKYNSPQWYDWCVKNWGTKWNVEEDVDIVYDKNIDDEII